MKFHSGETRQDQNMSDPTLSCTKQIKNIQNYETCCLDAVQFYSCSQYQELYNKAMKQLTLVRSLKGDLLGLRVHARFCRHRVFEKVATLPTCPSDHHKLRLTIDCQLCLNIFYILQLLLLPHECGQIHQKPPFLSMTQTRESRCTQSREWVPRSRKSRFPKYFKLSKLRSPFLLCIRMKSKCGVDDASVSILNR